MPPKTAPAHPDRIVAFWLFGVAAMVAIMVVVGGTTRLTGSGLSMVEWRPLVGWLPPLSDSQWARIFELYRDTPEFRLVNSWMALEDFRRIFWWEYIHRLWGRLIGLVFLLPFLWFLARRMLHRELVWRLVVLFVLGAAQGAIGWWMVRSGLSEDPAVSHYRLCIHLSLAFLIFGLLLWTGFGLLRRGPVGHVPRSLRHHALLALVVLSLTVAAGALVAGLDAGLVYNTFPLMDGQLVPEDYASTMPFWLNAFENPVAVQLHHRALAILTLVIVLSLLWRVIRSGLPAAARLPAHVLAAATIVQAGLGIATLVTVVPVVLAVVHQAGAVAAFLAAIWLLHCWSDRTRPEGSFRSTGG